MPSCDYARRIDSPVMAPVTSPREQSPRRATNPSKITEEGGSRERRLELQGSSEGLLLGVHICFRVVENSGVANGPFNSQRRQYRVVYFLFKSCHMFPILVYGMPICMCPLSSFHINTLFNSCWSCIHSFMHFFIGITWTVTGPVLGTGNPRRNGNYSSRGSLFSAQWRQNQQAYN